jgi:type VI secretion system ImpM family protein
MVGEVSRDIVTPRALDRPAVMGKLPAHGDFIARGLDHALRERIDRWLSGWLTLARARLGDDFESAFCAAAPWLFEGVGAHAVLIPSVDGAGRLFPLIALTDPAYPTQAIYDQLIEAIELGLSGDKLITRLAAIAPQPAGSARRGSNAAGCWFLPEGAEQLLPPPDEAEGWAEVREVFA